MATKEVMVTAPILIVIFDRVFISRSFREAVIQRLWYYLGLCASWILLGFLMVSFSFGEREVGTAAANTKLETVVQALRPILGKSGELHG